MLVRLRRLIQPILWLIVLSLLAGAAIWAYDTFAVASWQTLDPEKLTAVAQKLSLIHI